MRRCRRSTIGVSLDDAWLAAAQVVRRGEGVRLERGVVLGRPDPGAPIGEPDVARLVGVLERRGFVGTDVSVVAPGDALVSAVLELPPRSSGAPIDLVARAELARMHELEEGTFAMGSWDLPHAARARAASETAMLAIACPHERGDALAELLWGCGCELAAIDARSATLARACEGVLGDAEDQVAILDLGWSASHLVILHRGVVVYERTLSRTGIGHVIAALSEQLSIDPEVAGDTLACVGAGLSDEQSIDGLDPTGAAREIVREHAQELVRQSSTALGYAAHRYDAQRAGRLLVTGTWNAVAGIDEFLRDELSIETTPVRPGDCVDNAGGQPNEDPRLIAALGAAMRFDV